MTFLRVIFMFILVSSLGDARSMTPLLHEIKSMDGRLTLMEVKMPEWVIDESYVDDVSVVSVKDALCDMASISEQNVESLGKFARQLNRFDEFRDDLLSLNGIGDRIEDLDVIDVCTQLRRLEYGDLSAYLVWSELVSPSISNKSAYSDTLLYDDAVVSAEQLSRSGLYIQVLYLCKNGLDKNRISWSTELLDIWGKIHDTLPVTSYLSWAIAKSLQ